MGNGDKGVHLLSTQTLADVLRSVDAVLFDFDGPLCDVFANYPAPGVAQHLKNIAKTDYATDDPLEVLRRSTGLSPDVAFSIETALVAESAITHRIQCVFSSINFPSEARCLPLSDEPSDTRNL
ncbi:hypothetical protein ACFQ1S_21190 [Kibdelosporangium lantanae]|uniref:Haloacid dehalogenase-like hydrolase n=1 Tax=Kibdelosporangium lantanae TaxID=1497396 RepID=A0ABW3MB62_9PSEU